MDRIHALVVGIIEVVILAAIINGGMSTIMFEALNVSYGIITAQLLTLVGNVALGCVLIFAMLGTLRNVMGNSGQKTD